MVYFNEEKYGRAILQRFNMNIQYSRVVNFVRSKMRIHMQLKKPLRGILKIPVQIAAFGRTNFYDFVCSAYRTERAPV